MCEAVRKFAEEWAQEIAEELAQELAEKKAEELAQELAEKKAEELAEKKAEELAEKKVEESKVEERIKIIEKLIEKKHMSFEDTMEFIDIPEEEKEHLRERFERI